MIELKTEHKVLGVMTVLLFALMFSAFAMPVMAQGDNHAIVGVVTFDDENATGVNVTLLHVSLNESMYNVTDADGEFIFELLNLEGDWDVGDILDITVTHTVNSTTYTETKSIVITSDSQQRVDFDLVSSAAAVTTNYWMWLAIFMVIGFAIVIVVVVTSKPKKES